MAQVPQDVADVQGVIVALDNAVLDNHVAAQAAPPAAANPVSFLVLTYSFWFVSIFFCEGNYVYVTSAREFLMLFALTFCNAVMPNGLMQRILLILLYKFL